MKTVSLSMLKDQLSSFIDRVKKGEVVVVLDRGKPVASLNPVHAVSHSDEADIEALERGGVLLRGRGKLGREQIDALAIKPAKGVSVLSALLEERREGR